MSFDATFWVAISFFIFIGLLVYFKIPQNINNLLTKMIGDIKKEIDESEKLRVESKKLLDEAQAKLNSVEIETKKILDQAKTESEQLVISMNEKFHKSSEIKKNLTQTKINQMKELPIIVARTAVGKKVEVKIWRDKKEIVKIVTLGRLETSEDFKVSEKTESPKESVIKDLKVTVRQITKDDIKSRNLPNQTTGLVVTKIANDSPLFSSVEANSIILEAQKKKIRNVNDLNQIVKQVLNSNQKTILLVIYNSQNQRRYIGVKLD